jgi:hypothetical protein
MKILSIVSLAALCFCGCAAKEQTYWEKGKKGAVIVHHVRRTQKGTSDRTEMLTTKIIEPGQIHVYDLGRMADGNGGMSEAHRYYRVEQSETMDLRLTPASKLRPTGPKTVFTPPTYSPPPRDQRINDAVSEAHQAKDKLDEARGKIDQKLAEDNNLRGELQTQIDENQRLQDQLNSAMSTPQRSPAPRNNSAQSDASKAGQAVADPLASWGKTIQP